MTLHLTCAFEVIKLPNERVLVVFHHFFLQFLYISLKSVKKLITPQLQDPLSRAFHKYRQLLICILVDLGWVYQSTISKRLDKQCLRFQEGEGGSNHPLGQICQPKWLDHWRVKLLTFAQKRARVSHTK